MITSRLGFRLLCALSLLVVFAASSLPSAQAQDNQEDRPAALEAGTWALQFSVNRNFTLGSFRGSTISGRRYFSASRALEAGLLFKARLNNHTGGDNSKSHRELVGLRTRYLVYPLLGDRENESVQLVVGAGPELSFTRQGDEETSDARWSAGVGSTVGAEWFPHRHFSLFGYYESVLYYQHTSEGSWATGGTEFGFKNRGVRFGLSVYF